MKKVLVIGSGAGGATIARDLQGKFDVTVLEAGRPFRPFRYPLNILESLRKTGLFIDEREIQWFFPVMQVRKTSEKMVLINGIGTGGTTTIATGNALRLDRELKKIGIDLSDEFESLAREIPISVSHQKHWRESTRLFFDTCKNMGLDPVPTPKMGHYDKCRHCGKCIFGCPPKVKWDSRQFMDDAVSHGAVLMTGCRVQKVVIENGEAKGVIARRGLAPVFYPADMVILCAGGFGTPAILQNSGIACKSGLFVDPVLCVAAEQKDAGQNREVAMPFVVQREHFMLSPYFDQLSFFFNKEWRKPGRNILSLMIKLADTGNGTVSGKKVEKILSTEDRTRLQQGIDLCKDIFLKMGFKTQDLFLGTLNAGHPGGMLPLTEKETHTFHHADLPHNLYIADSTLLPKSPGNPPIWTIMAMARRVGRLLKQ
ncbi:GMC family oxidoreductase [bacterium]|nr:GMC family oxidoreductase [bacterium]